MLRRFFLSVRGSVSDFRAETYEPIVCASWRPAEMRAALPAASRLQAGYHTTPALHLGRSIRKREGGHFEPKKLVAEGEGSIAISGPKSQENILYPDETTPTRLFNGVMFKDLPIINVNATPNNTLIVVSDAKGSMLLNRTCGMEGFRNARKSTNVAAQATGFSLGKKMMQQGCKTARARVKGLGAGRVASLKGLTLAGVEIVSVTDNTPISWNPPRPRKQRRL